MKNNQKNILLSLSLAAAFAIAFSVPQAQALEINANVNTGINASSNASSNTEAKAGIVVGKNATSTKSTTSTSSASVNLTASGLAKKISSLTRLTETEKSVLTANLRADEKMRLLGPEISILSTIERVGNVVDSLQNLYVKLQTRVNATSTATTSAAAYLADMNSKLANASAQITAAQNIALTLKPDQGNNSIHQANLAALRDARSRVKAAIKDINDARRDAALVWPR